MAVAKVRADNNQQRAVKTTTAVIAVGKRRQARGEKSGGRQGQVGRGDGSGGGGGGGGSDGQWGDRGQIEVRVE